MAQVIINGYAIKSSSNRSDSIRNAEYQIRPRDSQREFLFVHCLVLNSSLLLFSKQSLKFLTYSLKAIIISIFQ